MSGSQGPAMSMIDRIYAMCGIMVLQMLDIILLLIFREHWIIFGSIWAALAVMFWAQFYSITRGL